jgi:hypothetical protein
MASHTGVCREDGLALMIKRVGSDVRSYATTLKVALMLACLFWTLVFALSESAATVPEFVYVNF